ncbi:hypothetical protein [uncultured Thiodictyon sp.]|uniref:hypothetical protein n=1 Tax=uncultured Thiodictyon sp. TaxID=1846217 RepID=UPI0025CD48F3|nr:hypothetical protein [uncultured Thiodictyon sp.]
MSNPAPALRIGLAVMATLALLALLHTLVLSDAPTANDSPPGVPALPGYRLDALPGAPAWAGRDHAYSAVTRYAGVPLVGGDETFTLTLMAVRGRRHEALELGALASQYPSIRLQDQQTRSIRNARAPPAELAIGLIGDAPALQTCIVKGGRAAVTREQLLQLIDLERQRDPRHWIRQGLGLNPQPRWECLLISISVAPHPAAEARLLALWEAVYQALATMRPAPWPFAAVPAGGR